MKKPSSQIILLEAVENIDECEKRISEAERMTEVFSQLDLVVCVQKLALRSVMSVGPKSFFSHIRVNNFRFSGSPSKNDVIMLTHQREENTGDFYTFLGSRFFVEKINTKDAETYIYLN